MKMKTYLIGLLAISLFAVACNAQSRTNRLYRPCSGSSTPASVEVQRDGDINLVPCSGRQIQINGTEFSSAFTVTGASRTNSIPYFSTQTNLTKSPFTWDGTTYNWTNSAAFSDYTMSFFPATSGNGTFRVGTPFAGPGAFLGLSLSGVNSADIRGDGGIKLNSGANITNIGDTDLAGNGTELIINDTTNSFNFAGAATFQSPATFQNNVNVTGNIVMGTFSINYGRTMTAAGVVGNQTINNAAGTVNFAAGTSAITVTTNRAIATSIIFAIARTNDATCSVKNVVPGVSSFVINMTANCTAETSVGFLVTN